ncbi:MAG: hypothetical protein JNM84_04775, partial [Planctomycetes bacterium]|nr:hypothetical protein [Planctomycetota bacterium]
MMHFREAQRKPALLPEFQGNVVAVETAPFWDDEMEALQERWDRMHHELNQRFEKTPDLGDEAKEKQREAAIAKTFTPQELQLLKGISNGGYHYLGAAKILAPVGKAFAVESLKLLEARRAKK